MSVSAEEMENVQDGEIRTETHSTICNQGLAVLGPRLAGGAIARRDRDRPAICIGSCGKARGAARPWVDFMSKRGRRQGARTSRPRPLLVDAAGTGPDLHLHRQYSNTQ